MHVSVHPSNMKSDGKRAGVVADLSWQEDELSSWTCCFAKRDSVKRVHAGKMRKALMQRGGQRSGQMGSLWKLQITTKASYSHAFNRTDTAV